MYRYRFSLTFGKIILQAMHLCTTRIGLDSVCLFSKTILQASLYRHFLIWDRFSLSFSSKRILQAFAPCHSVYHKSSLQASAFRHSVYRYRVSLFSNSIFKRCTSVLLVSVRFSLPFSKISKVHLYRDPTNWQRFSLFFFSKRILESV